MTVYFVRAGDDGPIKIGVAIDAFDRVKDLQTAHWQQLNIVRTIPGDVMEEQRLHRYYKDKRIRGEWYRFCPTMLEILPSNIVEPLTPMSPVVSQIAALEARATSQAIDVPAIWARAGIHRTTWQRWKAESFGPTLENWLTVESALDALIAERDAALPLQSDAQLEIPVKPEGTAMIRLLSRAWFWVCLFVAGAVDVFRKREPDDINHGEGGRP